MDHDWGLSSLPEEPTWRILRKYQDWVNFRTSLNPSFEPGSAFFSISINWPVSSGLSTSNLSWYFSQELVRKLMGSLEENFASWETLIAQSMQLKCDHGTERGFSQGLVGPWIAKSTFWYYAGSGYVILGRSSLRAAKFFKTILPRSCFFIHRRMGQNSFEPIFFTAIWSFSLKVTDL